MRPAVAPLLLVLALATPVRAVPITGYAIGRVTANLSYGTGPGGTVPYAFALDETIYVSFLYDLDLTIPRVTATVSTSGGFSRFFGGAADTRVTDAPPDLRLYFARDPVELDMRFVGEVGTIEYTRELAYGIEGFRGTLARVPDNSGFPVPEPPGLMLGGLGAALVGLWIWRGGR